MHAVVDINTLHHCVIFVRWPYVTTCLPDSTWRDNVFARLDLMWRRVCQSRIDVTRWHESRNIVHFKKMIRYGQTGYTILSVRDTFLPVNCHYVHLKRIMNTTIYTNIYNTYNTLRLISPSILIQVKSMSYVRTDRYDWVVNYTWLTCHIFIYN